MKYRGGYKYQLAENEEKVLPYEFAGVEVKTEFLWIHRGTLYIKSGYAWDGASGPTWDSESSMTPSLVHDALYQLMRMGLLGGEYRAEADKIFRDMCIEKGMFKWRANLWYKAVRLGAKSATLPENRKKEYEAP